MNRPTPTLYVFFNTDYPTMSPATQKDGQLSTLIIFFIAFAAFIALLIMICLVVVIYNICRYGSCCPPSSYPMCCWSCTRPPAEVQVVKSPSVIQTIRSSPYPVGSYVSRGTRLNQGSYLYEPRTIRAGTLPISTGRRQQGVIIVGDDTMPRRQTIRAVRPQILIADRFSDPRRVPTIGRSMLALPSSSHATIRCFPRNEPVTLGNLTDDSDIRVIVRNQPYTSQRSAIIEAPVVDTASFVSPPPAFDSFGDVSVNYGYSVRHSVTADITYDDQAPDYTSDDGAPQQTVIYPTLF